MVEVDTSAKDDQRRRILLNQMIYPNHVYSHYFSKKLVCLVISEINRIENRKNA